MYSTVYVYVYCVNLIKSHLIYFVRSPPCNCYEFSSVILECYILLFDFVFCVGFHSCLNLLFLCLTVSASYLIFACIWLLISFSFLLLSLPLPLLPSSSPVISLIKMISLVHVSSACQRYQLLEIMVRNYTKIINNLSLSLSLSFQVSCLPLVHAFLMFMVLQENSLIYLINMTTSTKEKYAMPYDASWILIFSLD